MFTLNVAPSLLLSLSSARISKYSSAYQTTDYTIILQLTVLYLSLHRQDTIIYKGFLSTHIVL